MSMSRTLAIPAAMLVVILSNRSTDAGAASLTLIGPSAKVCQLTGDADWLTGQASHHHRQFIGNLNPASPL